MMKFSICVALLVMSGCSNRAVYENLQINKRNECSTRPPSQYEECIQAASKSYEEFEREREELLAQ